MKRSAKDTLIIAAHKVKNKHSATQSALRRMARLSSDLGNEHLTAEFTKVATAIDAGETPDFDPFIVAAEELAETLEDEE